MAALGFEDVTGASYIDQEQSFAVYGHPIHLAWLEIRNLADGDELCHAAATFVYPFPRW